MTGPAAGPGRRRAAARGQAALEVLAAVPIVVLAALAAWQFAAAVAAGMAATERAREAAIARLAGDEAGAGLVVVSGTARVAPLLPGLEARRVVVRAAVRVP